MSDLAPFPRTPGELIADARWTDREWRSLDGKTFYQFAEQVLGVDKTAHLWWDAMCLDVARSAT